MSNIPSGAGLDVEDFTEAVARVASSQYEDNLGGPVELQIRSGEYDGSDMYLEVADVLVSKQTGRVVILAGKRVAR